MCLDMSFAFSNIPEGYKGEVVKLGDLATIEKKKPHDFSSAMREAMTDADTYTVTFVDPGLTPQQKACIIATVIQLDYMFFENGACTLSDTPSAPGPLRAPSGRKLLSTVLTVSRSRVSRCTDNDMFYCNPFDQSLTITPCVCAYAPRTRRPPSPRGHRRSADVHARAHHAIDPTTGYCCGCLCPCSCTLGGKKDDE